MAFSVPKEMIIWYISSEFAFIMDYIDEFSYIEASSCLVSYATQDHLLRGGTPDIGLGILTSIINQDNTLTDLFICQPDRSIFCIEVLYSHMLLAYVNLNTK